MLNSLKLALAAAAFTATAAGAVVTVTIEASGVVTTTQANVGGVANLDALANGTTSGYTYAFGSTGTSATIDTFTVNAADLYGGAGGTGKYGAVLPGGTATITFTGTPTNYFGFYASAIDGGSRVTVYDTTNTVVYTSNLPLVPLSAGYFGNPSAPYTGQNAFQGYAFFNLNSTTAISRIVLTQAASGGNFEFDNLAAGTTVPEPATWALLMVGFGMVGFAARRRSSAVAA